MGVMRLSFEETVYYQTGAHILVATQLNIVLNRRNNPACQVIYYDRTSNPSSLKYIRRDHIFILAAHSCQLILANSRYPQF
jgi:hypothetical protein